MMLCPPFLVSAVTSGCILTLKNPELGLTNKRKLFIDYLTQYNIFISVLLLAFYLSPSISFMLKNNNEINMNPNSAYQLLDLS